MPVPSKGLIEQIPDGSPAAIALLPAQRSEIWLARLVGQLKNPEYSIAYRSSESGGSTRDSIVWGAVYRAEGRLKLAGCEIELAVFDFNSDGIARNAESLQLLSLAEYSDETLHSRVGEQGSGALNCAILSPYSARLNIARRLPKAPRPADREAAGAVERTRQWRRGQNTAYR
jgi:hypothetical protein